MKKDFSKLKVPESFFQNLIKINFNIRLNKTKLGRCPFKETLSFSGTF